METVDPPLPAPASRLILFIADGLRADKVYEGAMHRAPFLKSRVEIDGIWGVSHTRVPTESRPGHVAAIAGFYEDVSAVTKGWKANPVNFDSFFNQTSKTWSFGSPDILPMFAHGTTDPEKMEMFMYGAEAEDFGTDGSHLDTWVFDKLDQFLDRAIANATLDQQLRQPKVAIFLHLLGLDTNGHAHRPYSPEYLKNIGIVDKGISKFVARLEDFYGNDHSTAYVFTADHGMSDRGSHGDGHPDNTQTPIIAWGAGIRKPIKASQETDVFPDNYSEDWQMSNLHRSDVNQADIAPFMSTLIGVPYPKNSVGVLPLDYLDNTESYKARAAFGNAKQILAQFVVKETSKRRTELLFQPFKGLVNRTRFLDEIEGKISKGDYLAAERASVDLVQITLDGLRYYQTYDWLFLRSIISTGYLGWIVYSSIFIIQKYSIEEKRSRQASQKTQKQGWENISAIIISLCFSALLWTKESPILYYAYVSFPIYFWTECIKKRVFVRSFVSLAFKQKSWTLFILQIALYLGTLEVLVFSYFNREVLSVCLCVIGLGWPASMSSDFRRNNIILLGLWVVFCGLTGIFTLLPVEKVEDIYIVVAGGAMIILSGLAALYVIPNFVAVDALPSNRSYEQKSLWGIYAQLAILVCSVLIVYDTTIKLQLRAGLPIINQTLSWIILASCILIPTIDGYREQHFFNRLVLIYLSFAPVFVLLSVSYEALFYCCFSVLLMLWLLLERQLHIDEQIALRHSRVTRRSVSTSLGIMESRKLTSSDLRTAAFFLLFINVSFFGTGNIASISSFNISSVYRFTTIFDPFLMGAIIIFKIMIPFFLLSAIFGVISRCLALPPFSLFLLVMSTTDIMTLNFFFLVRDNGSWLEIGTTISHFIIASAFIVFQIILFSISHALIGKVLIPKNTIKKVL